MMLSYRNSIQLAAGYILGQDCLAKVLQRTVLLLQRQQRLVFLVQVSKNLKKDTNFSLIQ